MPPVRRKTIFQDMPKCLICLKEFSEEDITNKIIQKCSTCYNKCHANCAKFKISSVSSTSGNETSPSSVWNCESCKHCVVCKEPIQQEKQAIDCPKCDKCYHRVCHMPKIHHMTKSRNFVCCICGAKPENTKLKEELEDKRNKMRKYYHRRRSLSIASPEAIKQIKNRRQSEYSPNPSQQFEICHSEQGIEVTQNKDINVEPEQGHSELKKQAPLEILKKAPIQSKTLEIKDWSIEKVHDHFHKLFPDHSQAFLEHEIDGEALQYLNRFEVTCRLMKYVKLGIAIKIYYEVRRLQKLYKSKEDQVAN